MATEKTWSIDDIKCANKMAGRFYFEPDTMRFFRSRVLDDVYQGPGGVYFVTSEHSRGLGAVRLYSVRKFNPETADVSTAGKFQEFVTARAAKHHAARLAEGKE